MPSDGAQRRRLPASHPAEAIKDALLAACGNAHWVPGALVLAGLVILGWCIKSGVKDAAGELKSGMKEAAGGMHVRHSFGWGEQEEKKKKADA